MSTNRPQDVADILEGMTTPTPNEVYEATRQYDNAYISAAAASKAHAGGGGGGSAAVACVLARDASFTIHDGGGHDILWDALYDDLWNLDPLLAIPAGLGLTFAFDGSSSLIVADEAGIWTLSYFAERQADAAWAGSIRNGIGLNFPWQQQLLGDGSTIGQPFLSATLAGPLPAGTQMTHQVATDNPAVAGAYNCDQVWLSIVRHA